MKPTPSQLAHCIAQVTRFIPTPPPPKVKIQKSKWGLKVGDKIVSPSGETFTIDQADSGGLILGTPDGKCARLTSKDELGLYSKPPKAPKVATRKRKVPRGGEGDAGERGVDGAGGTVRSTPAVQLVLEL